jgi:uncharacterized protein
MNVAAPIQFDPSGRTSLADDDAHILQMIEMLLFTAPGERVNRPDFGCRILQLIFAGNSPELAEAVKFSVQADLQRWLGDLIELRSLQASSEDSTIRLSVQYLVRLTGEVREVQMFRGGLGP